MQLQPPTDNLYKFLAIGGLGAIIASCYLLVTHLTESSMKRIKLEQEFQVLLDEFHIKFGSDLAHDGLWPDRELPDPRTLGLEDTLAFGVAAIEPKERPDVRKHINFHYHQLNELVSHPSADKVTRDFWKKWYKLSDAEMDRWIAEADSPVAGIRQGAIEFRPRFERAMLLVDELWLNQDTLKFITDCCRTSIWIGAVSMVLGFCLWYVKVQRLQDEILKLDWADKQSRASK